MLRRRQADPRDSLEDAPGLASTLRPMLRLAAPVLGEQILLMMVQLSDTILTGRRLEETHLAAMSQMAYVMWLLTNLFVAVDSGATALVARFMGAGDVRKACRVTNQAFLAGCTLSVCMTLVGLVFTEPLVAAMGLPADASALAVRYLRFLLPALPLMMVLSVGNACLRGAGDTVSGFVAMIAMNVVNVLASWGLVCGWGPLPELGWDGVAIGTAAGYSVGGLTMGARLVMGRHGLRLRWRLLRPDLELARRLLRIGVPAGADVMTIVACQFWFKRIVNDLGSLAAAAHGVAISIESLAYLPGTAFQVAATTLAGQHLGAKNQRQALHSVLVACLAGGALMSAVGLLFFTASQPLAWIFLSAQQAAVAERAAELLRIVAVALPALAVHMVLSGALRGAGDTRWPLAFSLVGMLAVRIPLAYWLTQSLDWGVAGAWYAMAADIYVRCLLVVSRFAHGGWKRVEV
ncbi:MAG TPA: MATE family efflux transporter [Pirellulales bacterium]|nr:MATE family efflux transporter [Pirellulales bacterium]